MSLRGNFYISSNRDVLHDIISERLENLYFVRLGIKFPYQPLLTLQIHRKLVVQVDFLYFSEKRVGKEIFP